MTSKFYSIETLFSLIYPKRNKRHKYSINSFSLILLSKFKSLYLYEEYIGALPNAFELLMSFT